MKKSTNFLIILLTTILITRTFLYFLPRTSRIYTDRFHHIYIGLALLIIYFLIRTYYFSYYLLAFTLALILDQITSFPFYIANLFNKTINPIFINYWSPYSVISTLLVIIITIILIKIRE